MGEPTLLHITGMTSEDDAQKIKAELKSIDFYRSDCEYEDNRVILQSKTDVIEPELIKDVIAKINKLGFQAVEDLPMPLIILKIKGMRSEEDGEKIRTELLQKGVRRFGYSIATRLCDYFLKSYGPQLSIDEVCEIIKKLGYEATEHHPTETMYFKIIGMTSKEDAKNLEKVLQERYFSAGVDLESGNAFVKVTPGDEYSHGDVTEVIKKLGFLETAASVDPYEKLLISKITYSEDWDKIIDQIEDKVNNLIVDYSRKSVFYKLEPSYVRSYGTTDLIKIVQSLGFEALEAPPVPKVKLMIEDIATEEDAKNLTLEMIGIYNNYIEFECDLQNKSAYFRLDQYEIKFFGVADIINLIRELGFEAIEAEPMPLVKLTIECLNDADDIQNIADEIVNKEGLCETYFDFQNNYLVFRLEKFGHLLTDTNDIIDTIKTLGFEAKIVS